MSGRATLTIVTSSRSMKDHRRTRRSASTTCVRALSEPIRLVSGRSSRTDHGCPAFAFCILAGACWSSRSRRPSFSTSPLWGSSRCPALGEEKFAADMIRSPGGGAITAVGASRLGLSPPSRRRSVRTSRAISSGSARGRGREVDRDAAGAEDADDGRAALRRRPRDGHDRSRRARPGRPTSPLTRRGPSLPVSTSSSSSPRARLGFITCGDDDGRAYAGRPPAALAGAHAFFVNQREALGLTGARTSTRPARRWPSLPRRSSSRSRRRER